MVAKAHEVRDRLDDGGHRAQPKDAHDLYRLLTTSNLDEVSEVLELDAVVDVDLQDWGHHLDDGVDVVGQPRASRSTSRVGRRWSSAASSIPPLSTSR
jgi:hypothetical protein